MKKNAMTKIIAGLACFGILLSVLGTGLLIIFGDNNQQQEFTPEQIAEIQEIIASQSGSITGSGEIETPTEPSVIDDLDFDINN